MEDPPDEAYERVTNPERFAPLLPAAENLVADLERRFEVIVTRGSAVGWLSSDVQPVESIWITPRLADQAPLTITTTSLPGLYLDVGAWQHIAFPGCACDACDEHVEDAVRELEMYCTALAEGRLSNALLGDCGPDWNTSGEARIGAAAASCSCLGDAQPSCVARTFNPQKTGAGVPGQQDRTLLPSFRELAWRFASGVELDLPPSASRDARLATSGS
ncbi:DUF6226 family protein [Antrihabitans stalactiti]|uniref:Uncharacterized protein n=1 Tax=Antrihabitans stalactiti TaxID=2584121 RepID=A0A848KLN2_9NOCA|nr:hypothetical protein [Antrihabitans stalactiti]